MLPAESQDLWLLALTVTCLCLLSAALGAWAVYYRSRQRKWKLESEIQRLSLLLEHEKTRLAEKVQGIEEAGRQLQQTFQNLSNQALQSNNENFLRLAREKLAQHQIHAEASLEKKEKAIETLLHPITEILKQTESQIQAIEKERKESFRLADTAPETDQRVQTDLRVETQNLVQALRRPEVRGQWGELTLKRIAELAGMVTPLRLLRAAEQCGRGPSHAA